MRTKQISEDVVESSTLPVEVFETTGDRERREWAENSGDYAFGVLRFLQGRRFNEVSLIEIERTQTFARSTELEKSALRFVASQAEQRHPISEEDQRRLRERDNFLMKFVAGETLGHANWVAEIRGIPAAVAHAQAVDAALFPKTYVQPQLFSWVFNGGK